MPELSLAVTGDHVTTLLLSVIYVSIVSLGQDSKIGFVLSIKAEKDNVKLTPKHTYSLLFSLKKKILPKKNAIFNKIHLTNDMNRNCTGSGAMFI